MAKSSFAIKVIEADESILSDDINGSTYKSERYEQFISKLLLAARTVSSQGIEVRIELAGAYRNCTEALGVPRVKNILNTYIWILLGNRPEEREDRLRIFLIVLVSLPDIKEVRENRAGSSPTNRETR